MSNDQKIYLTWIKKKEHFFCLKYVQLHEVMIILISKKKNDSLNLESS